MELLYEMWLHTVCGFEPEMAAKAAPLFEKQCNGFESSDMDIIMLRNIGIAGEFAQRIAEPEFFKEAEDIIEYCKHNGIRIITMDSGEYPERLKNINTPPRILFAKGARLNTDNEVAVSVVGCRKPTDHGKSFARLLGKTLGKNNITVISGMAEGIDGQAHMGALDSGGKTIAVLAGSVDVIYPQCHQKLYRQILEEGGTILSERPPRTPVKKYFYQQRNRIIAGLSNGTVFVEGKEASGTSITAHLALDSNCDVFAVPGNPMLWQSQLPNRLIAEGAIMVYDAEVPVQHYREQFPDLIFGKETTAKAVAAVQKPASEDDRILDYLRENGGIARLDELAENLNMSVNVLSGRLTILCIKGSLRQESGNKYVLVE